MADWNRLEELFHAALALDRDKRGAFLQQACPEDEQLRKEVQALLARADSGGFLEGSPLSSIQTPSVLRPGKIIGRLRIVDLIGAGGMGEVYRATDERLNRDVAVKVLRPAFLLDVNRMRRFEEEARAAGMLNHPNIVAIYDAGVDEGIPYVVTELLAGKTLRVRLAKGPLPFRKAIAYAVQIARGLAAAHQKGIVHRDLKPENIFLVGSETSGGLEQVKILDFGLAKLLQADGGAKEATATVTEFGVAMGTVGYMSPEQLRGEKVDHRADIFAFGVVLFEMLAARRAFLGRTSADVIGATLREDPPDLLEIDPKLPEPAAHLVRHCLEKQPEDRFESARDLVFALEAIGTPTSSRRSLPEPSSVPTRRLRLVLPLVLAAAAIVAISYFMLGPQLHESTKPSFEQVTYRKGLITTARFVPGGSDIVYSAAWDGTPLDVFSGRPGQPDARSFGLSGAQLLSVSSTGEMALLLHASWLYYFQFVGTLARASLSGGAARELLDNVTGADWSPDGSQLAVVRSSDEGQRLEFPPGKLLYEARKGWIEGPRVGPRGDRVAFIFHATGGNTAGSLWVVDREGHAAKVSPEYENIRGLAWFGSNEILYSASVRRDETAVYVCTLAGKRRLLWRAPALFTVHDVAADGGVLLTDERVRYESFGLPPGAGGERNLGWADIDNPTDISDDGGAVLLNVEINDMSVYLRKMDGSPAVRLGKGFPLALSHDRKQVLIFPAFHVSNKIGVLPTGAGEPSWHGAKVEFFPRGGSWLPDNRRAVLIGRDNDRSQLRSYLVDTGTGAATPVTPEGITGTLVSLDGKWLLAGPPAHRALYPLDGGNAVPIGPLGAGRPIRWSIDPDLIYMSEGTLPAHIQRVNLKSGKRELVHDIMPTDPAGVVCIDWVVTTPDARAYAYAFFRMQHDLVLVRNLR